MSDGNSCEPLTEARKLRERKRMMKAAQRLGIALPLEQPTSQVNPASGGAAQGTQNPNQEQEQHGTTLDCDMVAVTTSSVPGGNHPTHLAGDEQVTLDVPTIPVDAALPVPPQVPAQPPPSWEDTYQHALNTSILSGRFEDLRIIAFSRRVRSGRAGGPREMYTSNALVERALDKARLCEWRTSASERSNFSLIEQHRDHRRLCNACR